MDLRSLAQNHMTFMSRANEASQRRDHETCKLNCSKAVDVIEKFAWTAGISPAEAAEQINRMNQGE
uniref:Uncharacterized protein n=1 Tax=Pseudomonas phage Arace01 TaxID=3138526 RepID=A0AAU6W0N2_9VIRU